MEDRTVNGDNGERIQARTHCSSCCRIPRDSLDDVEQIREFRCREKPFEIARLLSIPDGKRIGKPTVADSD